MPFTATIGGLPQIKFIQDFLNSYHTLFPENKLQLLSYETYNYNIVLHTYFQYMDYFLCLKFTPTAVEAQFIDYTSIPAITSRLDHHLKNITPESLVDLINQKFKLHLIYNKKRDMSSLLSSVQRHVKLNPA